MSKREQSDELAPCRSPGANSLADNCNRRPFLSEGDCDRGDVDVHQFDDLPFCDPINPTPPDIPPQVLETQWNLNVPPPCACIDIAYKFKFNGFTKNEDMNAKGTFKSTGDCCEGEYETEFEFDLPCPIENFEAKKITVKTGWNCETEYEQVYIEPSEDKCTIDPQDINFSIGLPCPIDGDGDKNISINLEWGEQQNSTQKYLSAHNNAECEADEDSCTITPEDVQFNIGLPCPISEEEYGPPALSPSGGNRLMGCGKFGAPIGSLCGTFSGCKFFDDAFGGYYLTYFEPFLSGIGIRKNGRPVYILTSFTCTSYQMFISSTGQVIPLTEGDVILILGNAGIVPVEESALERLKKDYAERHRPGRIDVSLGWAGYDPADRDSSVLAKADVDDCGLELQHAQVSLELPCPIPEDIRDRKKKIKIDWTQNGDNSKKEDERPLVQKYDDCIIEVEQTDFDIGLPCPIPEDIRDRKKKIKIDWTQNGDNSKKEDEQPLVQKSDDCTIEVEQTDFDIGLPCPIPEDIADKKKKIKIDWTQNGDNSKKEDEQPLVQKSDDCTIEVEQTDFDIGLPCPLPTYLSSQKKKIKIDWTQNGDNSKKEDERPLVQKSDDCTIEVDTDQFDLGLPCPIPSSEKTLKIGLDWKDKKTDSQTVLKKDSNDCSIDMGEVAFDLGLPCPIPQDPLSASIKLKYGKEFKGDKQNIAHSSAGDCKLEADTPTFDLEIPCPLDSLEFDASLQESSGNWELSVVPKTDSGGDEGCSKRFEIRLFVPEYQTLTVLTGIGFDPSTMAITYTTAEISGRFSITGTNSGYETLPTATHVNKCC